MRLKFLVFFMIHAFTVQAKNVSLNFVSSTNGGIDYGLAEIQMKCMAINGWDVRTLIHENGIEKVIKEGSGDIPPLIKGIKKTLSEDTFRALSKDKFVTFDAPTLGKEVETIRKLKKHLRDLTTDLNKEDQLLITLNSHGSSDCASKTIDPTQTIDQEKCDSYLQLKTEGGQIVEIKTKEFIPIVKELQDRGVKVAIDLKNCYSGGAIKDFSKAGICAIAHQTADHPAGQATACGEGGENPDLFTNLSMSYCKGIPVERIFDENPRVTISDAEEKACIIKSLKILENGLDKETSIKDLFEKIRSLDSDRSTFGNIPMSSYSPYWILNSLGSIMIRDAGKNHLKEINSCAQDFKDKVLNNFVQDLTKVTNSVEKKCDLKRPIDEVLSKSDFLDNLYNLYTEASNKQSRLHILFDDSAKQEMFMSEVREAYEKIDPKMKMFYQTPESYVEMYVGSKPDLAKLFNQKRSDFSKTLKKLSDFVSDDFMKMQNKLYQNLMSSPEYRNCLKNQPHLKKALNACEEFKARE